MINGEKYFAEAEHLIKVSHNEDQSVFERSLQLGEAQVRATLALTAAVLEQKTAMQDVIERLNVITRKIGDRP